MIENPELKKNEDGVGVSFGFGGGAAPNYTIEELLAIILQANNTLSDCLTKLLEIVIEKRESIGEKFIFSENKIICSL